MLNDLTVVISGGAGKIGSAFSRMVVKNGGKVIIGDINSELGRQLVSELDEKNALFFDGNLTEPSTIKSMIEKGLKKFGKIDAGVHCAYPVSEQWGTTFEDLEPENLAKDLFNQLGGAIIFSQQMIHHFQKHTYGNLIHISSIQGISAPKFDHYSGTNMVSPIEYSAIKAGIISITSYLAKYCKGYNIRVNCISPGGILGDQPKSFISKYNADCISKGMLNSEDLCGTLLYLLSDQSKYVNGQNIIVDDGWML